MQPTKKKSITFDKTKIECSKYKGFASYINLTFKGERFTNGYDHTVDVSEMLYETSNKRKRLKCGMIVLFDFNKKNELMGIELIK